MGYFEASQAAKLDIESSGLVAKVKGAFASQSEPFAFGGTVDLYRIGQTHSGLHVALRVFRLDRDEGKMPVDRQMKYMEIYCLNAEALMTDGYRAPNFAVGVTDQRRAGILTEDLTKGGTVDVNHHQDNPYGWITENGHRVQVFIDIDSILAMEPSNPLRMIPHARPQTGGELKYFSDKNIIRL